MKILKFSGEWCSPCKQLSERLKGVTVPCDILTIDIDEDAVLPVRYNIRSVPTMVMIDDDSNEVSRIVGLRTINEIQEWMHMESPPPL